MNSTNTWKKEFDTQFVKDEGDKMEDTWLDAVGCVGPVKYFIQETINSLLDELKMEHNENYNEKKYADAETKTAQA